MKGGVEYRVIADQVGSPVLIVNASTGTIAEQISYDAWGNVTSDSNPGFQPFGFAGGLYDLGTGLVHFGTRDYDPQTGRWITKDPAGFASGDTNLYGYVVNDPVNAFDPLGLWEFGDPLPQGLVNAAAGFGDALSFGLTDLARNALGTNDVVNKCSGAYGGGELAGVVLSALIGGAAGLESAGAHAGEEGFEFSHWVPARAGGARSLWNGNNVTTVDHALSDPHRYRFMSRAWKAENPLPNMARQQWVRVPNVYKGAAAGAAYGAAGAALSNNCGCSR